MPLEYTEGKACALPWDQKCIRSGEMAGGCADDPMSRIAGVIDTTLFISKATSLPP
ncbi:MAG: hypothetical protein WB586_09250 [Chthoniobacterales bacterium]